MKIAIIDKQREDIQDMYKKQTTLAQYKVIQQDMRDQYFEEKA